MGRVQVVEGEWGEWQANWVSLHMDVSYRLIKEGKLRETHLNAGLSCDRKRLAAHPVMQVPYISPHCRQLVL